MNQTTTRTDSLGAHPHVYPHILFSLQKITSLVSYFLSLCGTSFLQTWWSSTLSLVPVQWLRFSSLISMTWLQPLTRELKLWLQATAGQGPLRSRPLLYLASIWCYFNQLQRSCLENPRDGGAWWAAVYGVAQCQTWLKRLSSSSSSINFFYIWHLNLSQHLFRV